MISFLHKLNTVLWCTLAVGYGSLVLEVAVVARGGLASPVIDAAIHWPHFGLAVWLIILTAVPLGISLLFWDISALRKS